MKRLIILLCFVSLFACQDKVICPAFQSTYILDDSTRNAYFSYVWQLDENTRTQYLAQQRSAGNTGEDSVTAVVQQPKTDYYAYAGEKVVPWRIQKRTKFGIIKNVPHPIKKYRMRTAPMENVLAPEPISNEFVAFDFDDGLPADSLSIAADSLSTDSLTVEPMVASFEPDEEVKKKGPRYLYGYDPSDNFNVEQQYYNKYFAQRLVDTRPLPEPKPVLADSLTTEVLPDSVQTKKGLKGLFKKKKREEDTEAADEEGTEPLEEETEEQVPDENEGGGR